MSITYLGYSQAKPEEVDTLRQFLLTVVLPAVRGSEGNESCQMWQSQADPTQFVVMEVWASVDAHRASIKNITQAEINEYMKLVAAAPRGGAVLHAICYWCVASQTIITLIFILALPRRTPAAAEAE